MLNYNKGNRMDSLTEMNTETSPVLSTETPVKRGRGRPAKYAKEEREQKYKETAKIWRQEHKEECKEYYRDHYSENHEKVYQHTKEYNDRARFALRVLSELWENKDNSIEFKNEKYKHVIQNLVEHKKIILI